MEEKMAKMKEYLHMDTEISHQEFKEYYSAVIDQLNKEYAEMDQATVLQARFICSIIKTNAEARSHKNKNTSKSFKKMAAKTAFWMEAIDYRLNKEGLTQAAIEAAMEEIGKNM